ncbi:hypothetical protein [Thalassospira sp.]|uniref:hypothetical protein n=1 Tax=Thalassospira sp. TaxID=1912094 RepID=UPI002733A965|nr:hypothetical protein [Thalassospira sp.]MDP2698610.1 hypothetical protein [Thalassospira sp.]
MVRFPITAQSVHQSRRRQTAYDGLECLSQKERIALGFETGSAQLGSDAKLMTSPDSEAVRGI